VIPYGVKIGFGVVELCLLTLFFRYSGRKMITALTWKRIRGWFGK